jgi:hypothetical protein
MSGDEANRGSQRRLEMVPDPAIPKGCKNAPKPKFDFFVPLLLSDPRPLILRFSGSQLLPLPLIRQIAIEFYTILRPHLPL